MLHDLYTGLIRAVGLTPANVAEASVTEAISADLSRQDVCLRELHIDRAYLSSHLARERNDELVVYCKSNAPPAPRDAASAFILMKPCSSSYANKPQKVVTNCANGWQSNISSPMSVDGKGDAQAIRDCAKISLICAGALSSTISMFWRSQQFLVKFQDAAYCCVPHW